MADEKNKRDQLEETLSSMKTDIAEIKKDMDNMPRWIRNEIERATWFEGVVFFYALGFAFLVAVATLSAEKEPSFIIFIGPMVIAFAVGSLCVRERRKLKSNLPTRLNPHCDNDCV